MTDGLLNQDEIDALLGDASSTPDTSSDIKEEELLTEVEKDTLGEIGNISMGTSATTLFTLLGQKVTITTPTVSITDIKELSNYYPTPFVAIDVTYRVGLEGLNLLILKSSDVKVIADLMMGGDGKDLDDELTEIDLSAIGEAMNQMVGSSSTSLSEMLGQTIDIEPPRSYEINFQEDKLDVFDSEERIVKISFKMIVGDLIDSEIMQLIPLKFAKDIVGKLTNQTESGEEPEAIVQEETQSQQQDTVQQVAAAQPQVQQPVQPQAPPIQNQQPAYTQPVQQQNANQQSVNVKSLEFQQFDNINNTPYDGSIDIIQEIPVEITVQLGKTMRKIGEILDYGPGTIIELDKLLGEPLEVYANGKYIAKGEVVVIEDNFGIRITEIVSPAKRIN